MARGLDHVVHAVHDLDAAAEFYRRAGFTVGARNRHPWGTHNCIVQLPGFFVELITVGEPELIRAGAPGTFSFGAFVRDFLMRGEGLAMLVLEGHGAQEDAAAFRAAGIGDFKVFGFEREARRPEGEPVKVAFSLAFATDSKAPEIGYFTCQQHYPENFWNPAFQQHANGATGIASVTIVSDRPEDHRPFLSAFTGVDEFKVGPDGLGLATARGGIQLVTPKSYEKFTGNQAPGLAGGARLAALRFWVHDKAKTQSVLTTNGIPTGERNGAIVVPPDAAFGATLAFEANR